MDWIQKKLNAPLDERFLFFAAAAFYILTFLIHYPPIYAFRDEAAYLANAYHLLDGTWLLKNVVMPFGTYIVKGEHFAPVYPLGNSAALIPFTWFGWESVFIYGMIWHLIGTVFFRKLAKLFEIESPLAFLFYLFYPGFVFFSRTIMSDIPTLSLFVMACYFYFKGGKQSWLAAVCLGISLLFRVSNVILLGPMLLVQIVKFIASRKRSMINLILPLVPFALMVGFINFILYGEPFTTGYSEKFTGVKSFVLDNLERNMLHYLGSLFMVYPFMLVTFFFSKKIRKPEIYLWVFGVFGFFSVYYFHDEFLKPFATAVLGTRFLFLIIPFFILAYTDQIEKTLDRFPMMAKNSVVCLLAFLLLSGSFALQKQHQIKLNHQKFLSDLVYRATEEGSVLIHDPVATELLQRTWEDRIYIPHTGTDKILKKLQHVDASKPIFLVNRDTIYGGELIRGLPLSDLEGYARYFHLERVVEVEQIRIYRLEPKR